MTRDRIDTFGLAKLRFDAAQIGYVITAGLVGGAVATLLITLPDDRDRAEYRWNVDHTRPNALSGCAIIWCMLRRSWSESLRLLLLAPT